MGQLEARTGGNKLIAIAFFAAVLAGCAPTSNEPEQTAKLDAGPLGTSEPEGRTDEEIQPREVSKLQAVPGELLVKFKSGASSSTVSRTLNQVVLKSSRAVTATRQLQRVKLAPGVDESEAIAAYRAQPEVEYVEPNYIVHASAIPNDPQFSSQWPLHNVGGSLFREDADIDAPEAWDITTGGSDLVIAVIDSGVDYTHPDLAANIYQNLADCNGNSIDDDGNGYVDDCRGIDAVDDDSDPMDVQGHGTHVAGIAAASGNNATGIAGVAWNARILPCRFLDDTGSGSVADAIECLEYVAALKDRGVNIVATNNSWGGGAYSQALHDAVRGQLQRGILFVAASGNDREDITDSSYYSSGSFYPCAHYLPNVICVGATMGLDAPDYYGNYSRQVVHIGAPGDQVLSTLPGNSYGVASGTSMAAPHVSGVAVLLKAAQPTRDWRALKNLILTGGDPLAWADISRGIEFANVAARRLNANGSLNCVDATVTRRLQPRARTAITRRIGAPITLAAYNIRCADPAGNVSVTINPGGVTVGLVDDGVGVDSIAGDGIYSAAWTPTQAGEHTLTFPGTTATAYGPQIDRVIINIDAHLQAGFPVRALRVGGRRVGVPLQIAVGDLDGVGGLEILMPSIATFGWHADGQPVFGWPRIVDGTGAPITSGSAYLSMGNLAGGTSQLEVSAGYNGLPGPIELYDGNGNVLPGWPRNSANYVAAPMALADIDGDGIDEIFTDENDASLHGYRSDGTALSGFPRYAGLAQFLDGPIVADIDYDGQPEFFAGSGHSGGGRIAGLRADGSVVPGFPVNTTTQYVLIGAADVDGDGAIELIGGTGLAADPDGNTGTLIVVGRDGVIERSIRLPQSPDSEIFTGALADFDGDGIPEIVTVSRTNSVRFTVHVVTASGVLLSGWPRLLDADGRGIEGSSVVVGDVDGDAPPEVVVQANGFLNVFNHDGTFVPGFPKANERFSTSMPPAIADIDQDGRNEIVVPTDYWTGYSGYYDSVYVYDLGGSQHHAVEWGQWREGTRRHAYYAIGKNLANDAYLSVQVRGSGTIVSTGAGIACGSDCIERYAKGTSVELTAAAQGTDVFRSWTGACAGQSNPCTVTVQQSAGAAAVFGPPMRELSVTVTGTGSVSSNPSGISCPSDCTESFLQSTVVTLSATPGPAMLFDGWGGACSGTATSCQVTLTAATNVTARFVATPSFPLHIDLIGNGVVTSSPSGINCGADCDESYVQNTVVRLTAAPAADSLFAGFSGACVSSASTCTLTMAAARNVTARFVPRPLLTVTLAGTGTGSVISYPAGITCGTDCSEPYGTNVAVTLYATAAANNVFEGWSGACAGVATSCVVVMSAAKAVTASFRSTVTQSNENSGSGGSAEIGGGSTGGSTGGGSTGGGGSVTNTPVTSGGSGGGGSAGVELLLALALLSRLRVARRDALREARD